MSLLEKGQIRLRKMAKNMRYKSHYHGFCLKGKHPLRLLGTPKDLWAGSLVAGSHILANRFYYDGQIISNPDHINGEWQGDALWRKSDLDQDWQRYLHSFAWLRDISRVVDRNAARRKAQDLVAHWLAYFDQWHTVSWAPEIIGQRIINWMAYAPLILGSNDFSYRSKLLNSLAYQARHLYYEGDEQLHGIPRFQAIGGLILAGLYIPYGENWLKKGTNCLKVAMAEEILPDGSIISRNPRDLYQILRHLLIMRASYKAMGHDVPENLDSGLGRMLSALQDLVHGDGRLALFNGANELKAEDIAATLIMAGKIIGGPIHDGLPVGENDIRGYRRFDRGRTVVIMDVGPPASMQASQNSHAGTLSFEMSYGKHRIIVNCGHVISSSSLSPYGRGNDFFTALRTTAAHSTVVINNEDSSEIRRDGLIGHGPTWTTNDVISENGHCLLEASHDGYLSTLGVIHSRSLYLNDVGDDIRGEDILEWRNLDNKFGDKNTAPTFEAIFHLHPDITVIRQEEKDRLLLRLSDSDYWQFQCSGGSLDVAESLYFGQGTRPQKSRQMILSGKLLSKKTPIKWSLRHIEPNS